MTLYLVMIGCVTQPATQAAFLTGIPIPDIRHSDRSRLALNRQPD